MAGLSDITSGVGAAVSDIFGAIGASQSASSYSQASAYAAENAELAQVQTQIQEQQQQRQIYQVLGQQQADIGGAGLSNSGTALDLMRSSAMQGEVSKAMISEQGQITSMAYQEQAGLYSGLAGAASASATGQAIGGALNLAGAAYSAYGAVSGLTAGAGAVTAGSATATAVAGADALGASGVAAAGADAAAAGAAATGVDTAAAAAGSSGLGDILATAAASWVVCTELHRQGRLPRRWYLTGARKFATYSDRVKRGYYLWAIPATEHLRANPTSLFSRFLEWTFRHRAEYIAAQYGVRGARKTLAGWATLTGVYAVCWALCWFVPEQDWTTLYRGEES